MYSRRSPVTGRSKPIRSSPCLIVPPLLSQHLFSSIYDSMQVAGDDPNFGFVPCQSLSKA